ncbi:MAG TPA: DUF3179 domain-containing protein [Verrucomicrobia bacterium]|nr:DUF3179 domain-containing protein [Verrucomicrobiota bacterium]
MYASTVKDHHLNFQVSGMLWNRSLVMRDVETGSLWGHILGRCMEGDLKGSELSILPGVMTTWGDWLKRYPETSVLDLDLDRTAIEYKHRIFENGREFVYGLKAGNQFKAYSFAYLEANPVVQESVGDLNILVAFQADSGRAFVFSRRIEDKVISFKTEFSSDGKLVDEETGSLWDPWQGKALDGPLKNQTLEHLPGLVSFRSAWETFYPDSEYVEIEEE